MKDIAPWDEPQDILDNENESTDTHNKVKWWGEVGIGFKLMR